MENDNVPSGHRKKIDQIRKVLIEGSAPKKASTSRKKTEATSINGNNNIVGDNNTIYNSAPIEKKYTIVKTGDGVLTAAQKAKLNAIIKEWTEARGAVRRSKAEIAAPPCVRPSTTPMDVNSYHEILQENFDKAVAWLRRQTGIVNSMASAPKRNPNWRASRYRAINARAKEFLDGEMRYRRYAEERFGSGSLKDLDDQQLEAVYRHVFGWRRAQD